MTGHPEPFGSEVEPPAVLDPSSVIDDGDLGEAIERFVAADAELQARAIEIAAFEGLLRCVLDAASWALAPRVLLLVRGSAEEATLRAVRWGFECGRRFPIETGASS